jgi:glucuronoarabinoxylan endo-1,4-beta-xylanase
MKRILFALIFITGTCTLLPGQASSSWETDFSNPGNYGNWVSLDEGADPHQFLFDYSNEEMHVTVNKTSWHLIQLWINPFDFAQSPYISFDLKTTEAFEVTIGVKSGDTWSYQQTFTTSGTGAYEPIFLNFSAQAGGMTVDMQEMQFNVPFGVFAGEFWIDNFKIGDAATPQLKPPTIDPISNQLLTVDAGSQSVPMTGITNGGDPGQTVAITATSDNPELIPSVTVNYTSPGTTGSLNFTPAAGKQGEATITVTLTDDGMLENETKITFKVLVMEYGGDGFLEDFESASLDTLWDLSNQQYALYQSGGVLRVAAGKKAGWESFSRKLPGFFDLSAHPYLNLDVQGSRPFYLHIYLRDAEDNTAMRELRVLNTKKFVTTSFDFSDATGLKLDRITGLIFAFNGEALSFDGDTWFDNLRLGSEAENRAYLGAVPDHVVYLNAGTQEQDLTDITHASGLQVSGTGHVTENLALTDISNGEATLSYDVINGATGIDTVTVTAVGDAGYVDHAEVFTVSIEENRAPLVDPVEDQRAVAGEAMQLTLSGIDDGNPSSEQDLEVTATSDTPAVIPMDVEVDYRPGPYATLKFTPLSAGTAVIHVVLADNGGPEDDTTEVSITVQVFESINQPPTIDQAGKQSVFNDAGEVSLELTGITDGDDGSQSLVLTAASSEESIVPNPVGISYTGGTTATLSFTPNALNTGSSTITVKVVDNGAAAGNNGNDSVYMAFQVETRTRPLTGWEVPLGDADILDYFSPEQEGVVYFLSTVDSGSFDALKMDLVNKWDWGGMWMDLPIELDLSDYPYISYDVYPVGSTLTKTVDGVTSDISDSYHWNYFYDAEGERNILHSEDHMYMVEPDQWTTLSFDYSDPGDMQTNEGEEIMRNRITDVLFNLHWKQGGWPSTYMSGTFYYRNIRIGDKAVIPEKIPVVTMDPVADQARYTGSGQYVVNLTGITNGAGSSEGVTLSAYSGRGSIVPDPVVSGVQPDGTATLTYIVGEKTGTSPMVVTVSAEGSTEKQFVFNVDVVATDVEKMAIVQVDRDASFQTMEGMGTFENEKRWINLYAGDLGASAVRIGLIGNQIEPVNDNHDPYVLDMKALNYSAIDFDYFRQLKENGVETFILTSWSPPAWMKTNLSEDWYTDNAERYTDQALNRLAYNNYDEFAESMVAVVRMFEQEAGIHLEAIGLQNEPAFDEPYASAILDPEHFVRLITVVGQRFEEEGITTRLYMPEQVVGQGNNSNAQYLDELQNDAVADPLCDIFAVHGYGSDGITPGIPSYSEWTSMFQQAQQGDNPKKLWMSETHIPYNGWSSAISTAGAIHGGLWAGNISLWTNWSFGDMQLTKNIPNSTFYSSKNYFKYIRPGAVRKGTQSDNPDVLATAFEHDANGTFTVVLINKGNNPISVDLAGNNLPNEFSAFRTTEFENFVEVDPVRGEMFILPASSVTTLYATENPTLTMDDLPSLFLMQDDPEQTVPITGISNGSGGTAGLSLDAESSDEALITGLNVTAVQGDGTASLSFTPGAGLSGTALVTVSLTDGSMTREVKFYVVVASTVGATSPEIRDLKVYPNPATDRLMVTLPDEGYDELVVLDVTGRTVIRRKIDAAGVLELNLDPLEKGLYHLLVTGGEKYGYAKFVVE